MQLTPIIRRILEGEPRPETMVVMVQEEVARNMAAKPGQMGLLSVAVQFYGQTTLVCTVPPTAFNPPPKVRSGVVRINPFQAPTLPPEDAPAFFDLVRAAFSASRKQLHNALAHGLGVSNDTALDLLQRAGLEPLRRPGTLSLDEWVKLFRARQES